MSLFKEAARLAAAWRKYREEDTADVMAETLQRIAALEGVSVEPVAYFIRPPKKPTVGRLSLRMDRTAAEKGIGYDYESLYAQQQLEAAVLKAHYEGYAKGRDDGVHSGRQYALDEAADWYDKIGWELNHDDVADKIRELKGKK